MKKERIGFNETFGITDPGQAIKDALKALLGERKVEATELDLSSTRIFKPLISIPTWLGIRTDRKIPIYNFYNRELKPLDTAYSVKVSKVRDYRGGSWTYDSHMGTDFAIPVGTHVTTVAPGKVTHVSRQFDHGGLKLFVDHGSGLMSTYGHLSRSLVEKGDIVTRGQSIALSGAAGVELLFFFPWVAPHLHLNIMLNGKPVDPFAIEDNGEIPMWNNGNDPVPHTGMEDDSYEPTDWDSELIDSAISECTDADERDRLKSIPDIEQRAAEIINDMMFYGTMFSSFPSLYKNYFERKPFLDLPFRDKDYDGVKFPK